MCVHCPPVFIVISTADDTSFLKSFSGFLGKEEIIQPKTGGMHCT